MELVEKIAYIKGLMEGMKFDTETNEGKIITALVDLVDDMAHQVQDMDEDLDEVWEEIDAISEDLSDVEDFVFEDEDEDDDTEEYEAGLYEITCPSCGEIVCVDEELLMDENLACPNCKTPFEVDFDEDCDCEEGCGCGEGCSCDK